MKTFSPVQFQGIYVRKTYHTQFSQVGYTFSITGHEPDKFEFVTLRPDSAYGLGQFFKLTLHSDFIKPISQLVKNGDVQSALKLLPGVVEKLKYSPNNAPNDLSFEMKDVQDSGKMVRTPRPEPVRIFSEETNTMLPALSHAIDKATENGTKTPRLGSLAYTAGIFPFTHQRETNELSLYQVVTEPHGNLLDLKKV